MFRRGIVTYIEKEDLAPAAKRICRLLVQKRRQCLPDLIVGVLEGAKTSGFLYYVANEMQIDPQEARFVAVQHTPDFTFGRIKPIVDLVSSVHENMDKRRILLVDDAVFFERTLDVATQFLLDICNARDITIAVGIVGYPKSSRLAKPLTGLDVFYSQGREYPLFYDPKLVFRKWEEFTTSWHVKSS